MSPAGYDAFYRLYQRLPGRVQDAVFSAYRLYLDRSPVGPTPEREFVEEFFGSRADYERYVAEYDRRGLDETIREAREEHRRLTGHGRFAGLNQFSPRRYYALVRSLSPETVVETGVCNGMSTLCVLAALEETGRGSLYSVDLPDEERLPAGRRPGWIVPDDLRSRWDLTLGRSEAELPSVLERCGEVDLFLHDSLAMLLADELDLVWPRLRAGGVVVADDIYASDDFGEWAAAHAVRAGHVAPNVGYMVKPAGGGSREEAREGNSDDAGDGDGAA